MTNRLSTPPARPTGRAIWRGVRHRCPACGKGRLFTGYLKPVATCASCGEDLSAIRAEDGPSWLTILLLGPVVVPAALFLAFSGVPQIVLIAMSAAVLMAGVLLLLPRVKGGFIGAIWAMGIQSSGP
jgi:uncharacterized protein (DUF983 family)